jgi:hypothetical protein
MTLTRAHRLAGTLGLALFLITGQYIHAVFPEIYSGDETIRYTMNATHVYLMFSALLNCALGLGVSMPRAGWRRRFGRAGSLLVLGSLGLLALGFPLEAMAGGPMRPITGLGVFLAFAGVLLRVAAATGMTPAEGLRYSPPTRRE